MRPTTHDSSTEVRQVEDTSNDLVQLFVSRPPVYYGDGPFDPPSSVDEEEQERDPNFGQHEFEDVETISLLSSTPLTSGRAESGGLSSSQMRSGTQKKHSSVRILGYTLVALVAFAGVIGIVASFMYSESSYLSVGRRRLTMDHLFNGTFYASQPDLNWVAAAGDGVFSQLENNEIKLVDLKSNTTRILMSTRDLRDEGGNPLPIDRWTLSHDMKYVLIRTSYLKQWRYSSFGNYYVHNIAEGETRPIIPPSHPPKTAYATWSPTSNAIAFVTDNDLYVIPSVDDDLDPIRVTTSGNASLFHGVPDWVYEEEVFESDYTLWWSPDSSKIAFLALDETAVPEFSFPIYNPTNNNDAITPYTHDMVMKYPKPGYPNPLVSAHVFDLDEYLTRGGTSDAAESIVTLNWDGRHPSNDSIIQDVTWVGNTTLILKEVNRNADDGSVVLFDLKGSNLLRDHGKVVRKLGKHGEQGDNGWIDHERTVFPIPSSGALSSFVSSNAYLDIVPTPEGYNHVALFSPADSSEPIFLTSGDWEVTDRIHGVDSKKGLVYFTAAKPSTERHLFSAPIQTPNAEKVEPTTLTDTTRPGYHNVKFSPEAGFYVLRYLGPNIPWTKVVNAGSLSEFALDMNEALANTTASYESATVVHSTFTSDGYELNVKELLPPRMDNSGRTKYPVLFRLYGGPASQLVDLKFGRDWHHYLACRHQFIVVTVDGRGTGFKGRKLRNTVKGNLGFFETIDQINAAKAWAKKPYVDAKRIGIWGWSYGGFMSAKVAEANAKVHSLAMAVAPVVSWRLYDTIYTERYMNLPALNPTGYVNASISNVEGFKSIDFLLAHGSGDDNVHFANTAHLLDMFVKEQVRNYRFRMFTDSDHGIYRRGAYRELYEFLTAFLVEKWGKGARRL